MNIAGPFSIQAIDDDISVNENSTRFFSPFSNDRFNSEAYLNTVGGVFAGDSPIRLLFIENEPIENNVSETIDLPSGAKVRVGSGSRKSGLITYDPNGAFNDLESGQTDTDSFTYDITDGRGFQSFATVIVTIKGVNKSPNVEGERISVNEKGTISGNLLSNDSDPDGDPISITILRTDGINYRIGEGFGGGAPLESGARFFVNNRGNYRYDPNGAFNQLDDGDTARDSFEYIVTDSNGNSSRARVEVTISGVSDGLFGTSFELQDLDGDNGFEIRSRKDDFNLTGSALNEAGDINNDGFDDVIVGAYEADGNAGDDSGESYIVFGKDSFGKTFSLSDLNGNNGFRIFGDNKRDQSGRSLSGAGDVNGDGIDDIIIGAPNGDPNGENSGESYIIFGKESSFDKTILLKNLDGSDGFQINGINRRDFSGRSVSSAGDINGDGVDDVIIGSNEADPNGNKSGQVHVVFGKNSNFNAELELSTLNGNNGFTINGLNAEDQFGFAVASAGDVNGDGINDIIAGSFLADPNGNESGESYVIFGKNSGFSSSLELSQLNGSNGFILEGINAGDRSGRSVDGLGDVNGDGFDDVIVGAERGDPNGSNSGESYVVFGKESGFDSRLQLSELDGSNGFVIEGEKSNDISGRDVDGAGDINNDGIDDIIIGARGSDANGDLTGRSYVIFGKESGFDSQFKLSDLDGINGFKLDGQERFDRSGDRVSAAGDVDGDGIDDLTIGALEANVRGERNAGEAYVVFGRDISGEEVSNEDESRELPVALSNGDPYITTFDSLYYESSATGEFVSVKTNDDNFEIQVRQENTLSLFDGDNPDGTYNTALAIKIGDRRVGLYAGEEQNKLRIDGELVDFQLNETIELENGSVTPTDEHQFIITHDDGSQVTANVFSDIIDYQVSLNPDLENSVVSQKLRYDSRKC